MGQAGIQIGESCWDLFCHEHNVQMDGTQDPKLPQLNENISAFFYESKVGHYTPRAVFVDTEPSVNSAMMAGKLGKILPPQQVISGKQSCGDNCAEGHYCTGKQYIDSTLEIIRSSSEKCSSLQGFFGTNCPCGGTGSGFTSLLFERLSCDYGKKIKIQSSVFASPHMSNIIVEPYNIMLSFHSFIEHTDISLLFDNEALYQLCEYNLGIRDPSYCNINKLMAQAISSMTSAFRFKGSLNADMKELCTNLVPYPRIHFVRSAYAPMFPEFKRFHSISSVSEITNTVFNPQQSMLSFTGKEKYIVSSLMYKGDVTPSFVTEALQEIRNSKAVHYVDYSPIGVKAGISSQSPAVLPEDDLGSAPRSVCNIVNSTAMGKVFSVISKKFDKMYAKRAFVHSFVGVGLESGEMSECREDMAALEKDYEEIGMETEDENEQDDDA